MRKKAQGHFFSKAGAALLQEYQQRDARHRQQKHDDHCFGQRTAALEMAKLGEADAQPERQEHHLSHGFGGGVSGDGRRGIGGVHPLEDHQPCRRDHAAYRREGRNLGNRIAHQAGDIKFGNWTALRRRQQEEPGKGQRDKDDQGIQAEQRQPAKTRPSNAGEYGVKTDGPDEVNGGDQTRQQRDGDADLWGPFHKDQTGSGLARKLHNRIAPRAVSASWGRKLGRSNSVSKAPMRRRFSE